MNWGMNTTVKVNTYRVTNHWNVPLFKYQLCSDGPYNLVLC